MGGTPQWYPPNGGYWESVGGTTLPPTVPPKMGRTRGYYFHDGGYYLKSLKSKSTPQDGAYSGVLEPMVAGIVEALRFTASPPLALKTNLSDPIFRWEIAFMCSPSHTQTLCTATASNFCGYVLGLQRNTLCKFVGFVIKYSKFIVAYTVNPL